MTKQYRATLAKFIRAERRKLPLQHIGPIGIEIRRRNHDARLAANGRMRAESKF